MLAAGPWMGELAAPLAGRALPELFPPEAFPVFNLQVE